MSKGLVTYADQDRTLGRRTARGSLALILGKLADGMVRVAGAMLLARLLTPDDFGLVAMVGAATSLLVAFKDLGLSTATIQRRHLTHQQSSTLFWINLGASLLLAVGTVALAPILATLFERPEITAIAIAIGLCFPLSGLSSHHWAVMQRAMRFRDMARVQVLSASLAVVAGVSAALSGWGYWSLIAMMGTTACTKALLVWRAVDWRPGRPTIDPETRAMIGQGGNLAAFRIFNHLSRNADNLLIGWAWGAASLAQYTRAFGLTLEAQQRIQVPVGSAVTAALSRLQEEPPRYRQFYLDALRGVCLVVVPLATAAILFAEPAIQLAFGPQWQTAAVLLQLLGLSMLLRPILNSAGWLYISSGRTRQMRNWGIGSALLILLGFVVALPFGTTGVAISYSVSTAVLLAPCMLNAFVSTGLKLSDLVGSCWRPYAMSGVAAALASGVRFATDHWPDLASSGAALLAYIAALLTLYRSHPPTWQHIGKVASLLGKRHNPGALRDRDTSKAS